MKVWQAIAKTKITHKENKHALLLAFYFASFTCLFAYICACVCFCFIKKKHKLHTVWTVSMKV